MIRRLGAFFVAFGLFGSALVLTGSPPAQAAEVVQTSSGCGTNLNADSFLPIANPFSNGRVDLPRAKFDCVLAMNQFAIGPFPLGLGVAAAASGELDLTVQRKSWIPFEVSITLRSGHVDGCIPLALNVKVIKKNPDEISFQCWALRTNLKDNGIDPQRLFQLTTPGFRMVEGSGGNKGTVNGIPPFTPFNGFPLDLLNPMITGLIGQFIPGNIVGNVAINLRTI